MGNPVIFGGPVLDWTPEHGWRFLDKYEARPADAGDKTAHGYVVTKVDHVNGVITFSSSTSAGAPVPDEASSALSRG